MKDKMTAREVYQFLRSRGHDAAALDLADEILSVTPEEWVARHGSEFDQKIPLIKEVRAKFGLSLKESKGIVDKHWTKQ